MITFENIARKAFFKVRLKNPDISEDFIEAAKIFAEEAYEWMRQNSSYDPDVWAEFSASLAAVEYVAAQLMGAVPFVSQEFQVAFHMWEKAASADRYSKENYNREADGKNNPSGVANKRVSRLRDFDSKRNATNAN